MNFDMNWFDDKGVSPVVGVILLVAVTVILSAVVGTFALDLGNNTKDNARGGVSIDENPSTGEVTVTVVSGGNSDGFVVKTVAGTTTLSGVGDSVTVDSYGEAVSVIGANNGKSNVIQRYEPSHELDGDLLVVEEDDTVATTTTHNSIQSAIDSSSAGDTVLVKNGTYNENITIDKSLTVTTEENAKIVSSGGSCDYYTCTVFIDSKNVTFKGFVVDGQSNSALVVSNYDDPVRAGITIRNNSLVSGSSTGLLMNNVKDGVVKNNYIKGSDANDGAVASIQSSDGVMFDSNTVVPVSSGMKTILLQGDNHTVTNSEFGFFATGGESGTNVSTWTVENNDFTLGGTENSTISNEDANHTLIIEDNYFGGGAPDKIYTLSFNGDYDYDPYLTEMPADVGSDR